MSAPLGRPYGLLPVICFGDGSIPEILLDCMQYRLVADRTAAGTAGPGHRLQLQRHIDRRGCRDCRSYLLGRLTERRLRERRIVAP